MQFHCSLWSKKLIVVDVKSLHLYKKHIVGNCIDVKATHRQRGLMVSSVLGSANVLKKKKNTHRCEPSPKVYISWGLYTADVRTLKATLFSVVKSCFHPAANGPHSAALSIVRVASFSQCCMEPHLYSHSPQDYSPTHIACVHTQTQTALKKGSVCKPSLYCSSKEYEWLLVDVGQQGIAIWMMGRVVPKQGDHVTCSICSSWTEAWRSAAERPETSGDDISC